jgi:hypothetical protein
MRGIVSPAVLMAATATSCSSRDKRATGLNGACNGDHETGRLQRNTPATLASLNSSWAVMRGSRTAALPQRSGLRVIDVRTGLTTTAPRIASVSQLAEELQLYWSLLDSELPERAIRSAHSRICAISSQAK